MFRDEVATMVNDHAFKLIVLVIARGHDNILECGILETNIKEKDTKRSQKNKTEHGTGKSVKPKSKKVKVEGPDKLNGSLQPIKDDSQDV
ncbi:hypothetical protein Tco_0791470 [Tanacetum coccineum]